MTLAERLVTSSVLFSPNDNYVVMRNTKISPDGITPTDPRIAVWELSTGEKVLDITASQLADFAFSSDSQVLAIADEDGWVRFWSMTTSAEIFRWKLDEKPRGLAFTPDGSSLAIGGANSPMQYLHLQDLRQRLVEIGLDW